MEKFSDNLITEITEYFKQKYNLDISPETAELFLDSLSDLYLSFDSLQNIKS